MQPQAHSYGVAVIGPGLEPQTPGGASARQHAIILEDDQVTSSHSNSPLSPEGPKHPSRLINRTLMVFLVAMISANIASQMGQPLMSLYVQSLGANVQQVGLLFTLTSIVPLAFQILGGFVSDSIGRLQAIAIGSLAGIAGYALYIVAPTWQWVILAQGISSLAGCFVAPSFRAFVAEQSSEEMRARTFALSESIYMITGVVGPPIGGIVSENYGYRAMFATAAALYGAATVIRISMARSAQNRVQTAADKMTFEKLKRSIGSMISLVFAGGILTWLFISDGVFDVAYSISYRFEPLYLGNVIGLGNTQIATLSSFFSGAMMLLLPVGGWFADRFGERAGLVLGHGTHAVALVLMLLGKAYPHFIVVWILYGVGASLLSPAYNSLISKVVPLKMRGTAFGLFSTSLGLISLPAPYVGGLLWNAVSPRAPFVVPLIASAVMTPLLWIKLKPEAESAGGRSLDSPAGEERPGLADDRVEEESSPGPDEVV